MSATDHYAEAERWMQRQSTLRVPVSVVVQDDTRPPTPEEVARAQAHATLALVIVAEKLLAERTVIRQRLSGA